MNELGGMSLSTAIRGLLLERLQHRGLPPLANSNRKIRGDESGRPLFEILCSPSVP
jgi:hypothetical protein